jgi:DNA-3-methyladenine glycosylase
VRAQAQEAGTGREQAEHRETEAERLFAAHDVASRDPVGAGPRGGAHPGHEEERKVADPGEHLFARRRRQLRQTRGCGEVRDLAQPLRRRDHARGQDAAGPGLRPDAQRVGQEIAQRVGESSRVPVAGGVARAHRRLASDQHLRALREPHARVGGADVDAQERVVHLSGRHVSIVVVTTPGATAARVRQALAQPPERAARSLLGAVLVRRFEDGRRVRARIVETEAYLGSGDPAAHSFRGPTPRTAPIWGPPGTIYVYLIYGMHHCLNVTVDAEGVPGCVLIRAADPLPGSDLGPLDLRGPGRLCRALAIDTRLSGTSLFRRGGPLGLLPGDRPARISVSPRIGIRQAAELPLRFFDADSAAVSLATGAPRSGPRTR